MRANCDNYYGGYYYATAYCTDFYNNTGSPNVTVFAPNKKQDLSANFGTLAATVTDEDEYDMKYMTSGLYNGAYVEFKGSLHLMGSPLCTIWIEVRG